jgi:hypothetical protein
MRASAKRRRRGIQRAKPHPKFGATKAQGRRYKRERDLANEIHDLKKQVAAKDRLLELQNKALNTVSNFPGAAIQRLMNIPFVVAVQSRLHEPLTVIADWLDGFSAVEEEWRREVAVASGKDHSNE